MTRTANAVRRMLAMAMAYCATSGAAHAQAAGSSTPASSLGGDVAQPTAPEAWAIHAQSTFVVQAHDRFRSLYRGANSLDPGAPPPRRSI